MSIYAISDLHLSFCPDIQKPMDIYGPRWHDHAERLKENWCNIITKDDTVILPGDISVSYTHLDVYKRQSLDLKL